MIPTANHSSRNGARVRLVVLHTTEGARDVASLGAYFQRVSNASYHGAMDDQRFESYVNYSEASWSILGANPFSDNAAFCAFASWDRTEWLRHGRMLDLGAAWVADRCMARNLPIRRLSLPEVAAAARDPRHPGGVIMHRDYTWATGDGTHTDCGNGLPWDVILNRALQLAGRTQPPIILRSPRREDNTMELPATITRVDKQVATDVVGGWCGAANLILTANTGGATVYGIYAVADRGATPPLVTELLRNDGGQKFAQWWPLRKPLANGTTSVIINYIAPDGMVARIEYEH
jgi:hypothetical protein